MDLYFIPNLIHDFFVEFNFIVFIVFLIFIIVHLFICFIIFDLYKSVYGKSNYLSWIPIINIYVLGDLLFGKTTGYVLCGGFVLVSVLNIIISNNLFVLLLSMIYIICMLSVFGFAIYRYIDLKKNKTNNSMTSNTLDLGNNISQISTNGPNESMINTINVIPTNNTSNINSLPIQDNSFSKLENLNANNGNLIKNENTNISNGINNVGLLNSNIIKPIVKDNLQISNINTSQPIQNASLNYIEEKHYEMPKLVLDSSNNVEKQYKNNIIDKVKDNDISQTKIEEMHFITGSKEDERMHFVTGIENDERMRFVTGDQLTSSSYSNNNKIPNEEKITVVNGVISSNNDIKNEEAERMNIINGTIVSNSNLNNQVVNNDSILDLNKKL